MAREKERGHFDLWMALLCSHRLGIQRREDFWEGCCATRCVPLSVYAFSSPGVDKCKPVLPQCFPVVALASLAHHEVSFKLNKCTYLAFDHIRSKFQLSSPVENGMANLHNLPLQIVRIPPANCSSQRPAADLVNDYD